MIHHQHFLHHYTKVPVMSRDFSIPFGRDGRIRDSFENNSSEDQSPVIHWNLDFETDSAVFDEFW